ncbi:MAG: HAD-IIIA family hydrolase [Polyangiaceae bacterium]|nr:HAD-IIIA family hydrolase [Polyangiaceae bacterium]
MAPSLPAVVFFDLDDTLIDSAASEASTSDAWQLYADVLPCLDTLANLGVRLGIISNGKDRYQRAKLNSSGLASHFTSITVSESVGHTKPDIEIFLWACRHQHVEPVQAVHVGDRLGPDARGAMAAGLHGIWLNRHEADLADELPTITSLSELVPLLHDGGLPDY